MDYRQADPAGWYWYRGPLADQAMVVHVYDVGKLFYTGPWPDGHTVRLERSFGEWAGPLEPPDQERPGTARKGQPKGK
jgi:hypothetical protein